MSLPRKTTQALTVAILAVGLGASVAPSYAADTPQLPTSIQAGLRDGESKIQVTSANLAQAKAMSNTRPVVFLVTAPSWCGACQALDPVINQINQQDAGKWVLAVIDTDRSGGAEREFGVSGLPTMIPFKNGQAMSSPGRQVGFPGQSGTRSFINNVMQSYGPVNPGPGPGPNPTTTVPGPGPMPTTTVPGPGPFPTTTVPGPGPFPTTTTTAPGPFPTTTTPRPPGPNPPWPPDPITPGPGPQPTTTAPGPGPLPTTTAPGPGPLPTTTAPGPGPLPTTTAPNPDPTWPWPDPTETTTAPGPGPMPTTSVPVPTTSTTDPGPNPTTTDPAPDPTTSKPAPNPTTTSGDGKLPELPPGAIQITDKNYDSAVIAESKKRVVVIDFSKDMCEPCVALAPIMDAKYKADKGKWQYVRLDGVAYPALWKKFDNPWFPTLVAMKDGKEIARRSGFEGDKAGVEKWLDQVSGGQPPKSDPLVMSIKGENHWQTMEAISKRHPVALRVHLDELMPELSAPSGKIAAQMAKGDGGKWTLANVDLGYSGYILRKHGVKPSALPQMIVFYNGKTRLQPLNGNATKDQMRKWVDTMLSTHYPPN